MSAESGSPPRVTVSCSDWQHFLDLYTKDLAHGGLLVEHPTALPAFSEVHVRLVLPEQAPPLLLPAEVVHVVPGAAGGNAHIGVQLKPLTSDHARTLKELLRLARRKLGLATTIHPGTGTLPSVASAGLPQTDQASGDPKQLLGVLREQLSWFRGRDPSAALGLSEPYQLGDVRRVYFKLCKRYHPDLYTRFQDAEITDAVTELFALIQNAYTATEAQLQSAPKPR